jgi:YHS domain-containing protein
MAEKGVSMTMKQIRPWSSQVRSAALAIPLLAVGAGICMADTLVNTGYFGNVAILGYDPVAYFTDGKAMKGSPSISEKWLGATWYFASTGHRDSFMSQPIRYAPQYGGFCAAGAAFGEASANIDPEAWRIIDGRLYLFSGKEGLEEDFDPAAGELVGKANTNWPTIEAKEINERKSF